MPIRWHFSVLWGRFPRHQPIEVQQDLLAYIAQRLGIDPKDIERYAQRRQTLDAHAEQIRTYLGYHVFAEDERLLLSQFLDGEVEHLESVSALVTRAEDFLRTQHVAFAMLGNRFCPRIRGLKKQRIYHADPARDYGPLQTMLARKDRRIHLDWITEHWDQIARLVASFAYGQ